MFLKLHNLSLLTDNFGTYFIYEISCEFAVIIIKDNKIHQTGNQDDVSRIQAGKI